MRDEHGAVPTRRPIQPRLFGLIGVIASVALLASGLAAPAQAAPTDPRTINGTVTDSNDEPLAEVAVYAYSDRDDGNGWDFGRDATDPFDVTQTDENGEYELTVYPDTYRLVFGDRRGRMLDYYHTDDDQPAYSIEEASDVRADDGATAPIEVNATLDYPSEIEGHVLTTDGNDAANVTVTPYRWHPRADDGAGAWLDATGSKYLAIDPATTTTGGRYDLLDVPTGTYRLKFTDADPERGLQPEPAYYGSDGTPVADFESADIIEVTQPNRVDVGGFTMSLPAIDVVHEPRLVLHDIDRDEVTGRAPKLGDEFLVKDGAWIPTDVNVTYQWHSDDDLVGQNRDTYEPTADDVGRVISVTITATAPGREPLITTLTATDALTDPSVQVVQQPNITGSPVEGGTLTVAGGEWDPADVDLHYQWFVDDEEAGTDAETFTPRAEDVGKYVSVEMVAVDRAGVLDPWSGELGSVGPVVADTTPPILNTAAPQISGVAQVGETLSIDAGTWDPADADLSYVWRANGASIDDATAARFTVTPAQLGKKITASVTATKAGYASTSVTTTATGEVVLGTVVATEEPRLTGTARVGGTLSVDNGDWAPVTPAADYSWSVGGTPLTDSDGLGTYSPTAADTGKTVSVEVTYTADGYTPVTLTLGPSEPVTGAVTSLTKPSISGDAVMGATLTVDSGTWDPVDAVLTFTWRADGNDLTTDPDAISYTVQPADVGKTITVEVTGIDPDGNLDPGTVVTDPVGPIQPGTLTDVPTPTLSTTTPVVGDPITVNTGTWSTTPQIHWFLDNTHQTANDNQDSYTPTSTDLGKQISVNVTYTTDGYTPVTRTATATAPVVVRPACEVGDAELNALSTSVAQTKRVLDQARAHHSKVEKRAAKIKRIKNKIKKNKQARKKAKQKGKANVVKKRTNRIKTKLKPKLKKAKQARKKLAAPRKPKPSQRAVDLAQRNYDAAVTAYDTATKKYHAERNEDCRTD